jgi:hypothetical protein
MPFAGIVYALDLGSWSGYAYGQPGEVPRSGTVRLKKSGDPRAVALGNLISFLDEEWRRQRPAIVAIERAMSLEAFKSVNSSEANVRMQYGLHAIVEGMCNRFGLSPHEVSYDTVRKHFLGVGRLGTREETKRAVVDRCHLLGFFPRETYDEDRADACAVHDWASATLCNRAASLAHFHLFGERAR